jgi:hypothetical protein
MGPERALLGRGRGGWHTFPGQGGAERGEGRVVLVVGSEGEGGGGADAAYHRLAERLARLAGALVVQRLGRGGHGCSRPPAGWR